MAVHLTITSEVEGRLSSWIKYVKDKVEKRNEVFPSVTLSREFGCQAYPVAEALQKYLDAQNKDDLKWILIDRILLEKVAEESGISKSDLQYVLDVNTTFQTVVNTILGPSQRGEPFQVFSYIKKMVHYFSKAGKSIIVGRGAVCINQDLPNCLNVRLIAPLEFRKKIIMENLKITEDEAQAHINKNQSIRDDFITHFTGMDISSPYLYDLVINNARFNPEQIAEIIGQRVLAMGKIQAD